MKTILQYFIISGLLITIVIGCKKGGSQIEPVIPDTIDPMISITQPKVGQSFVPGNTITFQANFYDNVKLGSYAIAITKVVASGCVLKNAPTPVDWSYTVVPTNFNSGVKQQTINLSDIVIPLDISGKPIAKGKYNFKVTCIDAAGRSVINGMEININ